MADNYSFRSAVGGFNRNDVIAYISKLMEENYELDNKNSELQTKSDELEAENQKLKNDYSSLSENLQSSHSDEIGKIQSEANEKIKAVESDFKDQLEKLKVELDFEKNLRSGFERKNKELVQAGEEIKEKAAQEALAGAQEEIRRLNEAHAYELEQVKNACNEKTEELKAYYEAQIAALSENTIKDSVAEKSDTHFKEKTDDNTLAVTELISKEVLNDNTSSDIRAIEKKYEARLGAAMMDAKRYSDILVKEANDEIRSLYSQASISAKKSCETANELSEEIKRTLKQAIDTLNSLNNNVKDVARNFDKFKTDNDENASQYEYISEFSDDEKSDE